MPPLPQMENGNQNRRALRQLLVLKGETSKGREREEAQRYNDYSTLTLNI